MIKKQDFISDLTLERYLLEEMDPQRTEYVSTLLAKDQVLME